jgi:DNA-binding NarL/FixJ family response regulator
MPGLSGITAAKELEKRASGIKIVFPSIHQDRTILAACHAERGMGYLIKVVIEIDFIAAMKKRWLAGL